MVLARGVEAVYGNANGAAKEVEGEGEEGGIGSGVGSGSGGEDKKLK